MKKIVSGVVLALVLAGSAFAGDQPIPGLTKEVSMAGSGGLEIAEAKCGHLVGSDEWQTCVAHHDGLYSLNKDGTIRRNYTKAADAPKPYRSAVTCTAGGFVNRNNQIVWVIPDDPTCRVVK